jgi:hypothetical protein
MTKKTEDKVAEEPVAEEPATEPTVVVHDYDPVRPHPRRKNTPKDEGGE